MKYTITFHGLGSELTIGHLDQEEKEIIKSLIEDEDLSLEEIMNNSEDYGIAPWNEIDDVIHLTGPFAGFQLTVTDENNDDVLDIAHGDLAEQYPDVIDYKYFDDGNTDEDMAICCVTTEKGTLYEAEIETKEKFDINKLKIVMYSEIRTDLYEHDDVVNYVSYDGVELDNIGGDSIGKGFDVYINLEN
jgi:hypothetical protein